MASVRGERWLPRLVQEICQGEKDGRAGVKAEAGPGGTLASSGVHI